MCQGESLYRARSPDFSIDGYCIEPCHVCWIVEGDWSVLLYVEANTRERLHSVKKLCGQLELKATSPLDQRHQESNLIRLTDPDTDTLRRRIRAVC